MAILSKIKSAAKKVSSAYSSATKQLQTVGRSIGKAVVNTKNTLGASVATALGPVVNARKATGMPSISSDIKSAAAYVGNAVKGAGSAYVGQYNAMANAASGNGGGNARSSAQRPTTTSLATSTPSLLTGPISAPSRLTSSMTARSSGGSLTSALPSATTGGFTGTVGALNGALATKDNLNKDLYGTATDQTGVDLRQDQGMTNVQALMKQLGLDEAPQTVRQDREYQRAVQEQQEAARVVDDYTAQLKTIEAKAQADQLSLEGQGRGIPEAIIGGQQAKIQREAAIKALPVAALLEAAQGRYEAAQSHVDTMFKIISDEIDNDRQYRKDVFNAVVPFMTAQEKRRLDLLDREDDRNDQARKELAQTQKELISSIVAQAPVGVRQTLFNAVMAAKDPLDAIQAAGVYGQKIPATSGTGADGTPLTAAQKTARDQVVTVLSSLDTYRNLYEAKTSGLFRGINLTGADAAELRAAYNSLMFQIAQAAGTGALQAADREIVEGMLPNPTSISGALGGAVRGGKAGGLAGIDQVKTIMQNKLNTIGGGSGDPLSIGTSGQNPLGI